MTIHEAIFAHLSGYADLTALVDSRIHPVITGEDPTFPAVSYDLEIRPNHAMGRDPIEIGTLKVYSWARDNEDDNGFDTSKAVAAQVRDALDRFVGTMGGAGGVSVIGCLFESESTETVEIGPDNIDFATVQEFTITYLI